MHYLKIINPLQGSFDRTVKEMIKNDMVKDVKELEMFGSRVDERNVSVFRHSNNESLWVRAFKSVNIKNMKYLLSIDSCIDVNEQDEQYGQSPIIYASIKNNIHAVKFLLNHPKINVNKCDSSGCSALLYAVKNDHFEIIQLLVESGADINIANSETGQTPIICSSIHNNVNTIELLLRQPQIDVNHFDNNGWSALMYGVKNGHFKIAQSLIEAGADINATQNNNNETPLLIAIKQGHVKLVLWMLDNGIKYGLDTTIKELQGRQVREYYCHSQNEDIVDGHDEFKNENKNSSNRNYDWIMGIRLLNELQERNTYSPCEMLCRDTGEILIDTSVTDNNGQTSWVYCWKSNNISLMTEYIRYHEMNNIKWNISEMDWSKHNNALTCLFSKICLYTKNGITFDKQIALLELMIHHFVNQFVSCTQSNIQFKWPTIAGDSMFEWLFTQLKLQEDHFAIMAWKKKIGRAFSIICGAIATILYKSETDSFTKSEMMFINTINSAKWVHFLEPSISLQSIQHFVQCLIDPIHPIKVNNILAMVDTYDSPLVMFAKVSVVQAKNEIFHQKCDELIRWLKCEYIVAGLESREKVIKFINTKSKQLNVTPIVLAIRNKNYYLAKMMLITFGCHVDVFDSRQKTWLEIVQSNQMELIQLAVVAVLSENDCNMNKISSLLSNISTHKNVSIYSGRHDRTPLFWAVYNQLYSILHLMLNKKQHITTTNALNPLANDELKHSVWEYVTGLPNIYKLKEMQVECTIENIDIESMRILIETHNIDVNRCDSFGKQALYRICSIEYNKIDFEAQFHKQYQAIQLLLENGAKIFKQRKYNDKLPNLDVWRTLLLRSMDKKSKLEMNDTSTIENYIKHKIFGHGYDALPL